MILCSALPNATFARGQYALDALQSWWRMRVILGVLQIPMGMHAYQ